MKSFVSIHNTLILFIFLTSLTFAEHNTTIDKYHKKVSEEVLYWADYMDTKISTWLLFNDSNASCPPTRPKPKTTHSQDIDAFFQNNRYLNDTRDIFIRLRLNSYLYTRESNKINARISAQLPFDRCKDKFNFYFQDDEGTKNEIQSTDNTRNGIGIRFQDNEHFGIKSSYSLGLSHGSPYFRARYKLPIHLGEWKIEPVQIFEYSHKYYFGDETNIYFDKRVHEKDLFRLQLHRKDAYDLAGMDYGLTLQYYWNLGKNAGVELTQSFFGNTHYNNFYSQDSDYHGINNYVYSIGWRANIWRKWLYYEIKPSINFHKDHNYAPSYGLRFLIDIYFGEYH